MFMQHIRGIFRNFVIFNAVFALTFFVDYVMITPRRCDYEKNDG